MRTYCATPVAIMENAGNNIQNHHIWPMGTLESTIAMSRNATPMKIFLNDCSSVTSLPRRRLPSTISSAGGCTIWPVSACGTRLMFAPHERQKLAPSRFCVAHLGQNILFASHVCQHSLAFCFVKEH